MALTNLTGDENQKTYEELFCSVEITGETHIQLICLSVLNSFLAIATFLGNTVVLVALNKKSFLHSPSKLMFRCLATSDLFVGMFSEPLIVFYWISVIKGRWDICRYAQTSIFITGHVLCSVSLLTLTGISVDRLLALLLGLRYRQVVTLKRTYETVTAIWVGPIAATTMYFWKYLAIFWFGAVGAAICLVIPIFSYSKIFLTLRRRQTQVKTTEVSQEKNLSPSIPALNILRYRKVVSGALWLQLALVLCYLPYGIVAIVMTQNGLSSSVYLARQFALTLVLFNSSLNPILYCLKIREVRKGVKDTIRRLYCLPN